MTSFDIGIALFTIAFALLGYRRGLLTAAGSLLGLVLGIVLGARLGGWILPGGERSPYAPLFTMAGAFLAGSLLATGLAELGFKTKRALNFTPIKQLDSLLGAVLAAAVALALTWMVAVIGLYLPAMQASGLRSSLRSSLIVQRLSTHFPPSSSLVRILARLDPLPSLPGSINNIEPPDRSILHQPGVSQAGQSVVKIHGTACGFAIQGSGWVVTSNLVVTNAHVVAGQNDTQVLTLGGRSLSARVVYFDTHNDLALLRVSSLGVKPLKIVESPKLNTSGTIIGYPEDGQLTARAARVGQTTRVISSDAYGHGSLTRTVTKFRGKVRSGNSGGPIVDRDGRVLSTVFAKLTNKRTPAGLGVPNQYIMPAVRKAKRVVSTGGCSG